MKYVIGSLGCVAILAMAGCTQSFENDATVSDSVQFSDMKDVFKKAKKAKKQADKQVKKVLIELARHDNTIDGVDFMFNTGFGL